MASTKKTVELSSGSFTMPDVEVSEVRAHEEHGSATSTATSASPADNGAACDIAAMGRISTRERIAVSELPDLRARIQEMGLSQAYDAWSEQFFAWRSGSARGARGELDTTNLADNDKGFGKWYPTAAVWQWRRTLSYWVAVTFFEGSCFFAFSSFAYIYSKELDIYADAVTSLGYFAGKINFIIGTYFMCLQTLNLSQKEQAALAENGANWDANDVQRALTEGTDGEEQPFLYWPFNYRKALANLEKLGAGPWPYWASIQYFVGCLVFLTGMFSDCLPPSPVVAYAKTTLYVIGSSLFTSGGLAECFECEVFTSLKCDAGWIGALFNFAGSACFLIGSLLFYPPNPECTFWGFISFGIGSIQFAAGSAIQIVMWQDEQFGLTFIAALNHLGSPSGRPMVMNRLDRGIEEKNTFSLRGSMFVMLFCVAAMLSIYNFNTYIAEINAAADGMNIICIMYRAFNALLPCVFAHVLLALNAGVIKAPKASPFRQLYFLCRGLALFMVLFGTAELFETLTSGHQHKRPIPAHQRPDAVHHMIAFAQRLTNSHSSMVVA